MKIIRALVATAAALAVGVAVQVASPPTVSADDSSAVCVHCWGVIGK